MKLARNQKMVDDYHVHHTIIKFSYHFSNNQDQKRFLVYYKFRRIFNFAVFGIFLAHLGQKDNISVLNNQSNINGKFQI